MMKRIVIIFLLLLEINDIKAQQIRLNFDHITSDDGLSNNRVQTIYRDSQDFLWIGTTNHGLNKFDSKQVTIYEYSNQPGSISNNSIRCIFEDSKNNLWIGTVDGLNLYDRRTDSFTVFRLSDSISQYGNYVTSIIEDKNRNLWITFNEGSGLARWDYVNNSFIRYRIKSKDDDKIVNSITSIKEDSKGNLWLASKGPGIYHFIPETEEFVLHNDPAIDFGKNLDKKLWIDKSDKIWIATFGKGLYSFDPSTDKFKHFRINTGNKGLNHPLATDVIQTDDDHLWIATDQGGINIYNMASNTFQYVTQDEEIENGLNNNGILCLYKDKEGIIWTGTSRGGVNYYNPKKNKFNLYKHNKNNPNSLSYNIVGCFYEDTEGLIWIGTDGGGLNIYNPETGKWTIFKHDPADPYSISSNVIRCIDEDANHDIWIGTWGAGLNRYDKKTGKFYHYFHDENDSSSLLSNSTWYLKTDHKNNIWLASYSSGLEIFDKRKGVVRRFTADNNVPGSLSSNDVWMIYEDNQQNIWICTINGINLYDSVNHTFKVYNQFPDNDIRAFYRDREGKLWAGSTKQGLYLFEEDGALLKVYNKKNGLPDNTIHAITEDNSGNLWISTNHGISRFNKKKEEFRNYVNSDGLQGNSFFSQSFLKTSQGEIYFGGLNGFNTFYPDSLIDNDFVPPVIFTEFRLFNKPVAIGEENSPLKYHINESEQITLSWKQSVFSFEFVGINYTNPEENTYKYMLEGFDKDWVLTDASRNYCTYTNLDPGEYTFRVKASNNDGIWNEQGKSIRVIITPPFTQTIWFKLIVIALISGLVYLFFFLRTRQLRNINAKLENKVQERTEQLNLLIEELKDKQNEIETTNEELTSTLEDLFLQKNHVEKVNDKLKNTQEELKQINEQLDIRVQERTQKLVKANRELDRFVYSASHDLSAPLKSILGLINISRIINKNHELQIHLNYMEMSVLKLEMVIKSLIQYSRNTGFEVKKDINYFDQIVEDVLNEINYSYDTEKVKIVKSYSKKDAIRTDTVRLKIILQNLISNAIKYRKIDAKESHVTISFSDGKDEYLIQIKDDGIGIEPQLREKIFTMFYRGTEQSDGSGLGLYIVKETLNKLNGKIQVESELNSYTLVSISIPKQSHNQDEIVD